MKFYNNVPLEATVDESNPKHLTTVGAVHDKLWVKKTRVVVDVIEHYELASAQDGSEGLKIVADGTVADVDKEIQLSDVQAKLLTTDNHVYAEGEYVILIPEQNHEEEYEEEKYARRDDIPEGSVTLSLDEWNAYSDNLVITASGYVEDTTTP